MGDLDIPSGRIPPAKWLDDWLPATGPCGLCGCGDQRHRILDGIQERIDAGETVAGVCADYGAPDAVVDAFAAGEWLELSKRWEEADRG